MLRVHQKRTSRCAPKVHLQVHTKSAPTGPSHWIFSKANWEQFHDVCLESISEGILEETDPFHSFVEHITQGHK